MSNRVVIQEGYAAPVFDGYKRKRRSSGGAKRQQNKMKSCAKQWKGSGSYRAHMKRCLSK